MRVESIEIDDPRFCSTCGSNQANMQLYELAFSRELSRQNKLALTVVAV